MLRSCLRETIKYTFSHRCLATKTEPAKKVEPAKKTANKIPLITCKIHKFNQYQDGPKHSNTVQFGQIPLASKNWHHYKSKSDYFTIHPISNSDAYGYGSDVKEFGTLGLNAQIVQNVAEQFDITQAAYIQYEAIPQILASDHTLIAAETGCGKTLAYLVPVIQQILQRKMESQASLNFNTPLGLILTPGRELATQIGNVAEKLCHKLGINVKVILGGRTKQQMLNPSFDDIDLLIGTVGAISKLVTTGVYRMNHVRHVVLDEADTLLDDSFSEKLEHFLRRFPFHKNHLQNIGDDTVGTQLILASATLPTNTDNIFKDIINTETLHSIVSPNVHKILPHVTQKFLRMSKSHRPIQLLGIVKQELEKKRPIIVFTNKSATSDYISIFLNDNNVECINLNGDMQQHIRIGQFEKFQNGTVNVLATTDIASRGLDTTRARHIINFDFPLHVSDYIHRLGRCGRIGSHEKCLATNFVSSLRDMNLVQRIEHTARVAGVLPNVNANITNIIQSKILKELGQVESNEI